jgi:hypothetical protein
MVTRAEPDKPQRPADSLNAAMPSDAGTSSFPEIPAPMLDIHAPHESIHTWKSFFVHLGTITIGLLIAIGLEQSVESLHHHRQVREMELKLHQESTDNLEVVAYDLKGCDTLLAAIAANVESLKLLGTQQSSASWSPVALPPPHFFIPDETVWLMMRDGGLLPLVPDLLAENYWKLDATESGLVTIRTALGYSGIRLNAAIDVYSNAGPLNSQDIGVLRAAYSDYAANLHAFRNSLDGYDLFMRRVLAGKSMDFRDVTEELGRARPH